MLSNVTLLKHSLNNEIDAHSKMNKKVTTISKKLGRMLRKYIKNFIYMTQHKHLLILHDTVEQVYFSPFNF